MVSLNLSKQPKWLNIACCVSLMFSTAFTWFAFKNINTKQEYKTYRVLSILSLISVLVAFLLFCWACFVNVTYRIIYVCLVIYTFVLLCLNAATVSKGNKLASDESNHSVNETDVSTAYKLTIAEGVLKALLTGMLILYFNVKETSERKQQQDLQDLQNLQTTN
jgi:ABC-type uncharacterized transport system permease subunit